MRARDRLGIRTCVVVNRRDIDGIRTRMSKCVAHIKIMLRCDHASRIMKARMWVHDRFNISRRITTNINFKLIMIMC